MTGPRFTHVAGTILGPAATPVGLAPAHALVRAWGLAAIAAEARGRRPRARLLGRGALELHLAAAAAARWRRCAGWSDPLGADVAAPPIAPRPGQLSRGAGARGPAVSTIAIEATRATRVPSIRYQAGASGFLVAAPSQVTTRGVVPPKKATAQA